MRHSLLMLLAVTVAFTSQATLFAQADVEALQKEVLSLKKEVELLKRERELLNKEISLLKSGEGSARNASTSKDSSAPGEINGAIWEITVLRLDGTALGTTKILAAEGRIYHNRKEVGTYSEKSGRAKMELTRSDIARANGTYNLVRDQVDPPSYRGTFRNLKGEEANIKLRIVQD